MSNTNFKITLRWKDYEGEEDVERCIRQAHDKLYLLVINSGESIPSDANIKFLIMNWYDESMTITLPIFEDVVISKEMKCFAYKSGLRKIVATYVKQK